MTLDSRATAARRSLCESIALPSGFSVKALKSKDLKVSGAKLKSVSGRDLKVTVNFKSKTKAATVDFLKGVVASLEAEEGGHPAPQPFADDQVHHQYAPATAAATNSTSFSRSS